MQWIVQCICAKGFALECFIVQVSLFQSFQHSLGEAVQSVLDALSHITVPGLLELE